MSIKKDSSFDPDVTLAGVGATVRNARRAKSLSQIDLASKTGLTQKTISSLENGLGTEFRTVLRVMEELGLKISIGTLGSGETIYSSEDGKLKVAKLQCAPNKEKVLSALCRVEQRLKNAGVSSLAVFGSTARDQAGPTSDVDVMAELSIKPDIFNLGKIQDILEEVIPFKVDFVLKKSLRDEIRLRAEKDAIYVIGKATGEIK